MHLDTRKRILALRNVKVRREGRELTELAAMAGVDRKTMINVYREAMAKIRAVAMRELPIACREQIK